MSPNFRMLSIVSQLSSADQPLMDGDLPQLLFGGCGIDDCVLWIFTVSPLFMFLRGKESISDIPRELPCLGDLENPSQLDIEINKL